MRFSRERFDQPVLMTALTTGLALVPLLMAAGAPGKEILYPVAVVVFGGLMSSTLFDILVTPVVFYHIVGRRATESIFKEQHPELLSQVFPDKYRKDHMIEGTDHPRLSFTDRK